MLLRLTVLLLLTSASADALTGGAAKTPFGSGISPADTKTWRCESGRTVVNFVPNTQSVWIFYRGQKYHLSPVSEMPLLHYSNVAPGTEKSFGSGLEWVEDIHKRGKMTLSFVHVAKNGQRELRLLETCRRLQS